MNVSDLLSDVVLEDVDPVVFGPMYWHQLMDFIENLPEGTVVSTLHKTSSGLWGTSFIRLATGFGEYNNDYVNLCNKESYLEDLVFWTVTYIPVASS